MSRRKLQANPIRKPPGVGVAAPSRVPQSAEDSWSAAVWFAAVVAIAFVARVIYLYESQKVLFFDRSVRPAVHGSIVFEQAPLPRMLDEHGCLRG